MRKATRLLRNKFIPFLLSLALILPIYVTQNTNPLIVKAASAYTGDASVSNKVDFSTDVIYQIVTDRFSDGNTANNPTGALYDSTKTQLKKYFGGDWQGVINKINDGYLSNMGITAIWVSQPVENIYSVFTDGSTAYHGYWARDFKATNPYFGNFTDFQNMVNAAHAKNIKVIIDFAPNHTSPADQTNTSYAENGKLYDNGTLIGSYSNDPTGMFHHNGGTDFSSLEDGIYKNLYDLADLEHQNNTVDSYMKSAIKKWLDYGIDGIRMDAVKHMPMGWQKNFMDTVYGYKPVFTFGEWFLGTNEVDPNNHYFANNSGMSLLDFRFSQKVRQVFRDGTDTMYGLDSMVSGTQTAYEDVNDQVTFIDNHDMDRFTKAGSSTKTTDLALVYTLTSRGVPAIYYGTEQYMTGNGDPNNRAMMTGFSNTTNAYQIVQKLAPLRKTNPAISYGNTTQKWINNDVYVYERKFGNSVAVIAVNKNLTTSANISGLITSLPAGTYSDVLGGLTSGNGITVGSGGAVNTFTLAAGGAAVWQYTATSNSPTIGHVGQPMARPGETVVIDGRGFGSATGTVTFGTTAATVVSWSDSQVKAVVPNVAAGKVNVSLKTSGGTASNTYANYDILTGAQVLVRFVVNNASTALGENVYLAGSVAELGNWDANKAIGAMFNQVVYKYPSWYYDVSVPAGTTIQFKYLKKNGSTVTWESGSNHSYTVPSNATGTVTVNWQP
jgi:glycosidase